MTGEVVYEVEIIGNAPPFRWKLFRKAPKMGRVSVSGADMSGSADSIEDAAFQAKDAAEDAHGTWLHGRVKKVLEVFRGPEDPPRPDDETEEPEIVDGEHQLAHPSLTELGDQPSPESD